MHSTKLVWFVLPSLAIGASAQVNNTNKPVRLLSLSETLELVLAHNLNLKVERIYPEVARYNVDLARAGGSSRVGLQRLGTASGNSLTERDASYDPTFFAFGSKSYISYPNYLSAGRYSDLQSRVNWANGRSTKAYKTANNNDSRSTGNYVSELDNQTEAQRDLIRANGDLRSHNSSLSSITENERIGRITSQEAQTQRAEEQARYENALANYQGAQSILANSTARLQAAQVEDARNVALNEAGRAQNAAVPAENAAISAENAATQAAQARGQNLGNWLGQNPIGSEMPAGGLVDPETGEMLYRKEIVRDYDFGTGLRGALPIGTIYEIRLDTQLEKSTLFDREYSTVASITLGQPLLKNFLTDAARTGIGTSKKDLEIAEWGLQFAMMDYLTRAQNAYYDLIFAQENVKVQEKAVELADQFLTQTTRMVQAQRLPPLDQKQAQSQAATARADLLTAQRDLAVKENGLKTLISDDFIQWQSVRLEPSDKLVAVAEAYNLSESWSKALQFRPEYNQARLEVEKQNIILKFRRNQLLPSLDLIGSLQQNGVAYSSFGQSARNIDGGDPAYFFGAIFSMPIFNRDARNRYKITQADKKKVLLLMKQLEQTILYEVDNNLKIAQVDYSRIEATREARLFAEAALETQLKMMDAGKATSFEVLQMQKNFTAARFAEINAMAAYNKALAQLYFSEGTTLERNHIRVQINK